MATNLRLRLDVEGLEQLMANLENGREFTLLALNNTLKRSAKILVPQLRKRTPKGASGKLKHSTTAEILGRREDMRLEIRQAARSKGGYFYGGAVRGGTRPHFPPYRELIPWVMKVLGVSPERAPSVAFLVARKISLVGTDPNPYHVRTIKANRRRIQKILNEEGQALVGMLAQT